MSEFKAQAEKPITASRQTPAPSANRFGWLTKPLFLGMSLPYLIGVLAVFGGACWYLFGPEPSDSVNRLAFGENALQPVIDNSQWEKPAKASSEASTPQPAFDLPQPQQGDVGAVLRHSEANRTAIERMVENYKIQAKNEAAMQQQIAELQAQVSLLSGRLSAVEMQPKVHSTIGSKARVQAKNTPAASPISGMRLSAIQSGMAWVYWDQKTSAVQVGDQLGKVVVTGIDADSRQVHTSGGTIE
jgi:intracellular multiplication protein IcmG